jgi:hypothetical protein
VAGERLLATRQVGKAYSAFNEAAELGYAPDNVAARLWQCAMLLGKLEEAWLICDAVLDRRRRQKLTCNDRPLHLQWVWDGSPLEDKHVLVRCHHGLGDTIQFVRVLTPLQPIARRVHLQAQSALLPLLRELPSVGSLSAIEDGHIPPHDVAIELQELPHALRLTWGMLPRNIPYLPAPPRPRRTGQLRVGLVWAAGEWKPERSLALRLLWRMREIPSVSFHCLQRGPALSELDDGDPLGLRSHAQSSTDDIRTTVTELGRIDLVISVDTMMAHLTGALGVPVWTLLHFDADWRWMSTGNRSPWYPTMRLVRQPSPGDWNSVVEAVDAALRDLAGR